MEYRAQNLNYTRVLPLLAISSSTTHNPSQWQHTKCVCGAVHAPNIKIEVAEETLRTMTEPVLPTAQEILALLPTKIDTNSTSNSHVNNIDSCSDDDDALREKLLQVFQYGLKSSSSSSSSSLSENDKAAANTAASVLTEVWQKRPVIVEPILTDLIWLHATPPPPPSTETPSPALARHEALKTIVSALLHHGNANEDGVAAKQSTSESLARSLQATLDVAVLPSLGLLADTEDARKAFGKKIRAFNTQQHYRQTKHNLLHEASDGYAKLLTWLLRDGNKDDATSSTLTRKEMNRFIGTFRLDPNRVLDLLLDLLEPAIEEEQEEQEQAKGNAEVKKDDTKSKSNAKPKSTRIETANGEDMDIVMNDANTAKDDKDNDEDDEENAVDLSTKPLRILRLIRSFDTAKVPSLLAFKLEFFKTESKAVPQSFYKMVTFLAKHNVLDMALLVRAARSDIEKAFKVYVKFMKRRIHAMIRIRLNNDGANRQDPELVKLQQELNTNIELLESRNALIGLLRVVLAEGDWNLAKTSLLDDTESWVRVCTLLPSRVGKPLLNHVLEEVSCVYAQHVDTPVLSSKSSLKKNKTTMANTTNSNKDGSTAMETEESPATAIRNFLDLYLMPLSALAKSGVLSTGTVLYCKLCRLFKTWLSTTADTTENTATITTTIKIEGPLYEFFKNVLVPTLCLFPTNPALSAELWNVLSVLPYPTRYRLYQEWRGTGLEQKGMKSKPYIQVQCETEAGKAARYTLKRLSKENVRDMGRQLAKVTHSNPLVVFSTILSQIESYDNLIQMMVETVRFVTPLSLDVLGYCVLTRLSGSVGGTDRERLKGT